MKTFNSILVFFLVSCINGSVLAQCEIDAAVRFDNNRIYFFQGDQYVRYSIKNKQVDPGYPKSIKGHWGGVWADGVDATFNYDEETIYLFKGGQCIRYSKKTNKALAGYPKLIRKDWTGVWPSGVDAALNAGNLVYFFKGDKVITLNKKSRQLQMVNGQAIRNIAEVFENTTIPQLNAALDNHNDYLYFFETRKYRRYNKKGIHQMGIYLADKGYPKNTAKYWKGLGCGEESDVARIRVKISYLKCEEVDDAITPVELIANKVGLFNSSEEIYGGYQVMAIDYKNQERIVGNRPQVIWYKSRNETRALKKGESTRIDEEITFDIPMSQLRDVNIHVSTKLFEADGEQNIFLKPSGLADDKISDFVVIDAEYVTRETQKKIMNHIDGGTHLKTVFYVQRME